MMHLLRNLLIAISLLPLAVMADTYVLKNGDRIEGDLIRETEDSYVLEVRLAPTIKDERVILKNDVKHIIKPDPGNEQFKQLRELVPAPDGLRVGDYKQRIELMTQFIEGFPANEHVRKAISIRDELRDEMRQVEDGAVKIDGVLYPATELRENAYELDARITSRKIKNLVSSRKHLQALRAYKEFQDEFYNTKVHLDLIPLMQQLISHHTTKAAEMRDTLNQRLEDREKGLETMTPSGRRASELAIQQEEDRLKRLFRTETSTQVGWVTVHPYSRQALDYTIQYSKTESGKLEAFLNKGFTDCGALYRELYKLKQQGADPKAISDKLRTCQRLGVPSRYLEKFALADGGR